MVCLYSIFFPKKPTGFSPWPLNQLLTKMEGQIPVSWFTADLGTRDKNLVSCTRKKKMREISPDLPNVSLIGWTEVGGWADLSVLRCGSFTCWLGRIKTWLRIYKKYDLALGSSLGLCPWELPQPYFTVYPSSRPNTVTVSFVLVEDAVNLFFC